MTEPVPDDTQSAPSRPSRPASVMILGLVMLVLGLVSLVANLDRYGVPRVVLGLQAAEGLLTAAAGFLLIMGPKAGWYVAIGVAALKVLEAFVFVVIAVGLAQETTTPAGGLLLGAVVFLGLGVIAVLVLIHPRARASYGVGSG